MIWDTAYIIVLKKSFHEPHFFTLLQLFTLLSAQLFLDFVIQKARERLSGRLS